MDIRLDLYRVFDAVARLGSFSAAAAELCISQPAVSHAMRELEQNLSVRLFQREARGVTLTQEGEALLGYVSAGLGLLHAGERRLRSSSESQAGELRIGAGDTFARNQLLTLLEAFHRQYPEIVLNIRNGTSSEVLSHLQSGRVDLGFVNMPISAEGIIFQECLTVQDTFVAGPAFEHLKGRVVPLRELSTLPLILLEPASNSRKRLDRFFQRQGLTVNAAVELGSHDLLIDFARIGLGVAGVVREFLRIDETSGLFELQVEPPLPSRSIALCYLEKTGLTPAAQLFSEMTRKLLKK